METNLIARVAIRIHASRARVWDALVNPEAIHQYMFGTTVMSDWRVGSPIEWKGEWQGKAYTDKGVILQLQPGRMIQYSHFSPLSGLPDRPENYHLVTVELSAEGNQTRVSLAQDNNETEDDRAHSEQNWAMMLETLKKFVENGGVKMSAFTPAEIAYLQSQRLGRIATAGPDCQPHVVPVGFRYNPEQDTIDVGGHDFAKAKKYRDVQHNPRVAIVIDDLVSTNPWTVRGIEIRGEAEILTSGAKNMGPGFDAEMFRIHPKRVFSWGLEARPARSGEQE